MPSKKKKKNPPVRSQLSRPRSPDTYELVKKVLAATVTSSVIMLGLAAYLQSLPEQAAAGGSRLFQILPPFVGVVGALLAHPVKDFFHTRASETVHAALIAGILSLLITGLIVLLT